MSDPTIIAGASPAPAPGDQAAGTPAAAAAAPAATPASSPAADGTPAPGATPVASPAPAEPAKPTAADAVPDKYEFTAPDGMELDSKLTDQFSAVAKELKLPQASADKLVQLYANTVKAQQEVHAETVKGWVEAVSSDKELGGDKLPATKAACARAAAQFLDKDTKEYLDATGLGNHPGLVRAFAKIGAALADDKVVQAGQFTPAASLEQKLYPSMQPK